MFTKDDIDALFDELKSEWGETPEFEQLSRQVHLGVAYSDAGRSLGEEFDARVVALIEKHKPEQATA
jgi:hypothetical protein